MTKSKKLILPLFLASSFLLAGCSSGDVVARPSWMDESIISNVVTKDNTMKEIYDAIKAIGTTNSDILNKVLYDVALKQFGNYQDDNDTVGLATIAGYSSAKDNPTEIQKFIDKYPMYKTTQTNGYYKQGKEVVTTTLSDDQKLEISYNLIKDMYQAIEDGVYEALYNEIKGGSYSFGNQKFFSEKQYIDHLYKNMNTKYSSDVYELAAANEGGLGRKFSGDYDENFSGTFKYKNTYGSENTWENYIEYLYGDDGSGTIKRLSGYLTVKVAKNDKTKEVKTTGVKIFESYIYGDYIKTKLIPEIYRNLLIQKYVKEQRYATIGRSYAREINMLSYTYEDKYSDNIQSMVAEFARQFITGDTTQGSVVEVKSDYSLEDLSNCLKGFYYYDGTSGGKSDRIAAVMSKLDKSLINKKDSTAEKVAVKYSPLIPELKGKTYDVYDGTKLAVLVKDISKVLQNTDSTDVGNWKTLREHPDKTTFDSLTNNGKYDLEEGIKIKEREIFNTNFIKDGWQLKSGITELNDSHKERLFNISTAGIIDDEAKKEELKYEYTTDYVRYVNNSQTDLCKAFLVYDVAADQKPWNSITIGDPTNHKVSICEVKNAISTSKASLTSEQNYAHILAKDSEATAHKSIINMNTIVNSALKVTSNTDTYKKNANQYYLMISNIIFHDTAVYNYFKSQFPDLFK